MAADALVCNVFSIEMKSKKRWEVSGWGEFLDECSCHISLYGGSVFKHSRCMNIIFFVYICTDFGMFYALRKRRIIIPNKYIMNKKTLSLFAVLAFGSMGGAMAQGDYYVAHGADVNITHATHYPKSVSIEGTQTARQELSGIASAIHCPAYFDKTSTVFEVKAGDIVTPDISINGEWMHGYVYVDWNSNGQFEVNLEGTGPYTRGEGNELMCWSHYNHSDDSGSKGWNSDGNQAGGNVLTPGSFRVPSGLPDGTTYRMRYKVQWNSTDPTGAGAKFISDGGSIIDVTLKVNGVAENVTRYPIDEYNEPRVGTTPDAAAWGTLPDGLQATWASRDEHYSLHDVPAVEQRSTETIYAWRGERANAEALLYSKTDEGRLSLRMTEWMDAEGGRTGIAAGEARFVNYVITDDYKACGTHPGGLETWLVPDVIDQDKPHAVPAMETRPVWCSVEVPRDVAPGEYTTSLEVLNEAGEVVRTLGLKINVDAHLLPETAEGKFHLDLWQQPYAVSRYYDVERWSDAHIEALRPYLCALGRAGQRTVSTIMFYEPWGNQTHDLFDPMVQTVKKTDGTWAYDYTVFDKYVELCGEYGIDRQINCFSMVPWDMNFRYMDEATGEYKFIKTTTGTDEYKELWTAFLTAFKAHLVEKGWFEKTNIAMDERAEADMLNAYNLASTLGFRMALAGNYHSSLCDKLQDFCVAIGQDKKFTAEQRSYRKAHNMLTTVYTSCADTEPNIYSNSLPAEAVYLALYAAANDLDGYLHWSWINWDEHPLTDSRYRLFGSGDTYFYYPGNRSGVRFERLVEGIQQYEKVMVLKEEYKDNEEKMALLEVLLQDFRSSSLAGQDCAPRVNRMEAFLNGQEVEVAVPENLKSGYYHIVSKATSRTEHIYNNALHSGNTHRFTLQSNTMVETNNGIWHVTAGNGAVIGVRNGDGNPMVAGASWGGSVAGTFNELTISETVDEGEYRYYYFAEAVNCTNGGANFKVGGADFITTWTSGPSSADDLLWRFEPVDTAGKYVYDVEIEDNAAVYVVYGHGSDAEVAFDGGFFIADSPIAPEAISVKIVDSMLEAADVAVEGNTIRVTGIRVMSEPERTDLYNTSKGDGVVPPYRIPGISTASDGRLITVAARLVCGTDPGYGQVDVVCRTSDDNGATWSDINEVAVGTGRTSATENYFDTAFGDPAVVADRDSKEVIVMAVAGCTVYGNSNTTRQNPNMIAVIRSMDNGETWQEPVDVTEQIYGLFDSGNPMQAAFVGGGKVFQSRIVKKGSYYRLYAALCARPNGNRVIYSDDFGRTWQALGGEYALPATGGDEPKCEEMPDGRVILSSRVAGGRIYNIYTYENTLEGTGDWGNEVKSTFAGAGLTPGNNSTNGEILVLPVVRNSDGAEMYLALQSLPTGSSRTDVGIFYKELSETGDMNGVAGFATGWDGFRRISTTSSAYSSMDLQADGRVGFIYEETLTGFGKRNNPVSTSFPTGAGQHNFDGFDNIYLAMSVEYITSGAYSLKRDADRGAFLRKYFTEVVEKAELSAPTREALIAAVLALGENPTTEEVDNIYALLASEKPADPWDGKTVTLTNVQQDGTEYVLYLNDSKELSVSSVTAAERGSAAEFLCTKRKNGKYTFYNDAKQTYMIWRAGKNYGYNNNKGTLDTYNATYCDWDVKDGGTSIEGTHYLVGKRSNGTADGTLIVMRTGVFDAWSNGIGLSANYSNLFRIDVKDIPDAIDDLHGNAAAPALLYDLMGRRVNAPGRGIYVSGGKKMLLR